jgi:hypothetical protein
VDEGRSGGCLGLNMKCSKIVFELPVRGRMGMVVSVSIVRQEVLQSSLASRQFGGARCG